MHVFLDSVCKAQKGFTKQWQETKKGQKYDPRITPVRPINNITRQQFFVKINTENQSSLNKKNQQIGCKMNPVGGETGKSRTI